MKRLILILTLMFTVTMVGVAVPALAADEAAKQAACEAINGAGSYQGGVCADAGGDGNTVNSLIATIVNLFSWIVRVMAVIFIIYGGFRYVTSGGDAGKITNAKNTIVYALIGLIIAVLAQVIVKTVLSKVTSEKPAVAIIEAKPLN